jgi:hypothetical protein
MLTSGAWNCSEDDIKLSLDFAGGGKLTGEITLDEGSADGLHVKLETGGSWDLQGENDLSFTFSDVAIAEAKRGDQALDAAEAEFFRGMFSDPEPVKAKISSISADKLVLAQAGKDDLTCTR